jgi:hypothetical protein
MAAVGNITPTEKKVSASDVAVKGNVIYARTITFDIAASLTAGTANLTGFTIPADTKVLGGSVKFSASQGSCTYKFSLTTDGDICAATTCGDTSWHSLATPTGVTSNADRVVTYTTADAATAAATCTLTLICCPVGVEAPTYTTFTI